MACTNSLLFDIIIYCLKFNFNIGAIVIADSYIMIDVGIARCNYSIHTHYVRISSHI